MRELKEVHGSSRRAASPSTRRRGGGEEEAHRIKRRLARNINKRGDGRKEGKKREKENILPAFSVINLVRVAGRAIYPVLFLSFRSGGARTPPYTHSN